ncbi:MAG: hypothetical protein IPK82_18350 [Polyangiaceae bacterium]|nr:hypothetical protein [Polyangiaceae bacterium]
MASRDGESVARTGGSKAWCVRKIEGVFLCVRNVGRGFACVRNVENGWLRVHSAVRFALIAVLFLAPSIAFAHERWVPNSLRFPINRRYFQRMSGEVFWYSLASAVALFGLIFLFYLVVPGLVERLSPQTVAARDREQRRGFFSRTFRYLTRLILDGDVHGPFIDNGLKVSAFLFSRVPAFVLALGAYEGWLVMPSFPVYGALGTFWRVASAALALWVLVGVFQRAIGAVMLAVFGYLIVAYGMASIDAVPVLASAFFYLFAKKDSGQVVNARQLLGMRVSLGVGFFLLGLINKIFAAELFIGVGDNFPDLVAGPQAVFPGLTREAWSFTTALGEMVFGLLVLTGVFNRITTALLSVVFANFILVFGWPEVVHVYPILGFVLLFFRGGTGTLLDGFVFRVNLFLWTQRRRLSALGYASTLAIVGAAASIFLLWMPLLLIIEVAPHIAGTEVPAGYRPPPLPPPAKLWSSLPPPAAHADHEPRHGGVVTMAGDVHVEIVVTSRGAVHLYVSDAVRTAIAPAEASGWVIVEASGAAPQRLALVSTRDGSLFAQGSAPTAGAKYTYDLQVRGKRASMALQVPAGGTGTP